MFLIITVANLLNGLLRDSVAFKSVFFSYIIELPDNLMKVFPVSCLMASLFMVNKLKNRNELTAIFASGFSRKDFLAVICLAGLGVAGLQFSMGAYVGPYIKRHRQVLVPDMERFKNLKSKGLSASTISSGKVWFKGTHYYFAFSTFDKTAKVLHNVSLYFFDNNYKLAQRLTASKLSFLGGKSWKVTEGSSIGKLTGPGFSESTTIDDQTIQLDEDPEDFKQIESDITTLNFFALGQYVQRLKSAGINTNEYEVILYDIAASSLVCIIFALMACNGVFNPNRRASSFGKNIFFVFVFTLTYWLVYSYLIEVGRSSKMNPLLACMLIPTLFGASLAVHFYRQERPRRA